jgi:hypothetical protein
MEPVDWVAGEVIIITSTDTSKDHAEKRTIASVDASGTVITLTEAIDYMHYSAIDYYGDDGDFIEIRAEVGLLSHNVVYRGDPETSATN